MGPHGHDISRASFLLCIFFAGIELVLSLTDIRLHAAKPESLFSLLRNCSKQPNYLQKSWPIEPHIPVFDKSNRSGGTFSRSDFVFDSERNHYTCPVGKLLVQFRRSYATPRWTAPKCGCAAASC